jgi:hypothetical protein
MMILFKDDDDFAADVSTKTFYSVCCDAERQGYPVKEYEAPDARFYLYDLAYRVIAAAALLAFALGLGVVWARWI